MEEKEQMYIVELLSGTLIKTGSFLAKDKNLDTYFARKGFFDVKHDIFLDLESNEQSKFAVIIDEKGTDKWEGFTFRTIQFISSSKAQCINYKECKTREEALSLNRMDLIEKQLQLLRSNSSPLDVDKIDKEIEILEKEINQIKGALKVLNALPF